MALTVSDREQSASFYARYFGLTERMHEDDHLLIIADAFGGLLALSEGQDNRNWPRTTHFGFEMESTAEVINTAMVTSMASSFRGSGLRWVYLNMVGLARWQCSRLNDSQG